MKRFLPLFSFAALSVLTIFASAPIALSQVGHTQSASQTTASGWPDPPAVEGITWTRFVDPNEHAFSLDVPAGWKVQGGLVRRGPVDVSMFLRSLSPDDSVMLIMGDPGPAVFGTPGFGAGPRAVAYRPGQQYARAYVESSLPSDCSDLTFISGSDRADIANGPLEKAVPGAQYDAGDAVFSCTHHGKPMRAYMVAGTYLYRSLVRNMPGIWGVNLLDGCIAPAGQIDHSTKIILHMLLSARQDPQWVKEQQGRVDQATRNINAITAAQQQAFNTTMASAQAQQKAMTQQFNSFDQILTQTATFSDSSGNHYQLQDTQQYHWIGPGGKTAETSSSTPPSGTGWTPLKRMSPPPE